MIKKHKLRIAVNEAQYHLDNHQEPHDQLEGSKQMSEEQHQDDEDMVMNDAYGYLFHSNPDYRQCSLLSEATPHGRILTITKVAYE